MSQGSYGGPPPRPGYGPPPSYGPPGYPQQGYPPPGYPPPQPPPSKWYHGSFFLALCFLLFFPLGLVLLWTSPSASKGSKIGVTIAVAILVLVAFRGASAQAVKAYVECSASGATLAAGMTCTLEHRQGDEAAHVCWDMDVKCQNGTAGKAHGCGDVQPQSKSAIVLPFAAFGGSLDRCDSVASASVTGVMLTAAK